MIPLPEVTVKLPTAMLVAAATASFNAPNAPAVVAPAPWLKLAPSTITVIAVVALAVSVITIVPSVEIARNALARVPSVITPVVASTVSSVATPA